MGRDLHKNIKRFGFIAGYRVQEVREQDPVNVEAAERMGKLHDQLKASGYTGHELEVYLVRLLFCLFADDTGIFQPLERFREYLNTHTNPDGSDLGMHLAQLFQILNTPEDMRQKTLDEDLAGFPYVNGKLFEEIIEYKKVESSELVNQSLFYLSWIQDHRGDFEIAVQRSLGSAAKVDWSDIRVICIAPNYKKYDLHAVQVRGGT